MPVSGVGSAGAHYPSYPPTNVAPALTAVMLEKLSDIAAAIIAKASHGH